MSDRRYGPRRWLEGGLTRDMSICPTPRKRVRTGLSGPCRPGTLPVFLALLLLIGLCLPPPVSAQTRDQDFFGRLFTTPEQRAHLDALRYAKKKVVKEAPVTPQPNSEPALAPRVDGFKLDGMVVRGRGPNTLWVDGGQVTRQSVVREGISLDPATADAQGPVVTAPEGGGAVRLRPGQTFDPEKKQTVEFMHPGP